MWGCWCDLLLSCCCSKAKRIACSRTCLLTCSAPQAGKVGFEMQMRSAARSRDGGSSGAPACARRPRWRFFSCSAAAALLFVPISASCRRAREQVAGRSPARVIERTSTSSAPQARAFLCFCCDQLKKTFFPCPALPGAAGFKNYGPICQGRGIACAVLQRMPSAAAGPPRRGSAAGTLCAPQAGNFSRWGRRGSIWGSDGGCGPKNGI